MSKNIKHIIDKYFSGNSSLKEEQLLREYFSGNEIDQDVLHYKELFIFFKNESEIIRPGQENFAVRRSLFYPKLLKWAAAIVIPLLIGFGVYNSNKTTKSALVQMDTFSSPDEAYEQTKIALMLVSEKLNLGIDKSQEYRKIKYLDILK